ncbi:unnamed protein product [Coccothraustes coccothraustes]
MEKAQALPEEPRSGDEGGYFFLLEILNSAETECLFLRITRENFLLSQQGGNFKEPPGSRVRSAWGGGAGAALCPLAHVEMDFGSGNREQRKGPDSL